jgi:hypothetical protein
MSAPTLIVTRPGGIAPGQHNLDVGFLYPGDELPPNLLSREIIDQSLDEGWLREIDATERPSLYRLFPSFSGVAEQEQLT